MTLTVLSSLGRRLGMALGSQPTSSWHGSLRREMNLRQFSAFVRLSWNHKYKKYKIISHHDFSLVSLNRVTVLILYSQA